MAIRCEIFYIYVSDVYYPGKYTQHLHDARGIIADILIIFLQFISTDMIIDGVYIPLSFHKSAIKIIDTIDKNVYVKPGQLYRELLQKTAQHRVATEQITYHSCCTPQEAAEFTAQPRLLPEKIPKDLDR